MTHSDVIFRFVRKNDGLGKAIYYKYAFWYFRNKICKKHVGPGNEETQERKEKTGISYPAKLWCGNRIVRTIDIAGVCLH